VCHLHIFCGSAGRRVNPAKIDRVGGSGPVGGLSTNPSFQQERKSSKKIMEICGLLPFFHPENFQLREIGAEVVFILEHALNIPAESIPADVAVNIYRSVKFPKEPNNVLFPFNFYKNDNHN
jgi:hypothetical protein